MREYTVPRDPGVYVLPREDSATPTFMSTSTATKRDGFTVEPSVLNEKWVPGAKDRSGDLTGPEW